ncbi:MAG: apolipoprotein A1/A4/E family protein [Lachnospiraceae bacterium]|nr:apolipoprotein A1/A4/E family protein [Lachnospiraceae bacterium]
MDKFDNQEIFEDEDFYDDENALDDIKEKVEEAKKDIAEKSAEIAEKVADKREEVHDKVASAREELMAKFAEDSADLKETFNEYRNSVKIDIESNRKGFNVQDQYKDKYMLQGDLAEEGYDWWWHSFTGYNRKTGEPQQFFIEYYLMNPALGGSDVVYGQLLENLEAGIRPSYMMVKAGAVGKKCVQIHRFFPWAEVNVDEGVPFEVSAGDCSCSENRIVGSVKLTKKEAKEHPEYMCDGGTMSWDLYIEKQIAFNVGLATDKVARDLNKYEMAWHAEGIKSAYGGIVKLGKEEYIVRPDDCYGYADKNWGSSYTTPWIWLASNDIVSRISGKRLENTAFVIGGGRPVVAGVDIEGQLLGALWYEGHPYEFNFSKPITLPKTQFRVVEGKNKVTWKIIQQTPKTKVYTSIECLKSEMLNNNYETPNGDIIHNKLWLGGTGKGYVKIYEREAEGLKLEWKLLDYLEVNSCGCEYGE